MEISDVLTVIPPLDHRFAFRKFIAFLEMNCIKTTPIWVSHVYVLTMMWCESEKISLLKLLGCCVTLCCGNSFDLLFRNSHGGIRHLRMQWL